MSAVAPKIHLIRTGQQYSQGLSLAQSVPGLLDAAVTRISAGLVYPRNTLGNREGPNKKTPDVDEVDGVRWTT